MDAAMCRRWRVDEPLKVVSVMVRMDLMMGDGDGVERGKDGLGAVLVKVEMM